jgi:hypothetical protein
MAGDQPESFSNQATLPLRRVHNASGGRLQLFGAEPVRKVCSFIAACLALCAEVGPRKKRYDDAAGQDHPAGDDLKYDFHDNAPRRFQLDINPAVSSMGQRQHLGRDAPKLRRNRCGIL